MEHQHPEKYTCPMHSQVVQDKPGTCPVCGMVLVLQKDNENTMTSGHQHDSNHAMGHEGHSHHAMMIADFKKRFYVVLVLAVPNSCNLLNYRSFLFIILKPPS